MRERMHTTLTKETLDNMEQLKKKLHIRYNNDLIEYLVEKESINLFGGDTDGDLDFEE